METRRTPWKNYQEWGKYGIERNNGSNENKLERLLENYLNL